MAKPFLNHSLNTTRKFAAAGVLAIKNHISALNKVATFLGPASQTRLLGRVC